MLNKKDPRLKGIYVKRCKCGLRPYFDRITNISPTSQWIRCYCGRESRSSSSFKTAIDNWNSGYIIES